MAQEVSTSQQQATEADQDLLFPAPGGRYHGSNTGHSYNIEVFTCKIRSKE